MPQRTVSLPVAHQYVRLRIEASQPLDGAEVASVARIAIRRAMVELYGECGATTACDLLGVTTSAADDCVEAIVRVCKGDAPKLCAAVGLSPIDCNDMKFRLKVMASSPFLLSMSSD